MGEFVERNQTLGDPITEPENGEPWNLNDLKRIVSVMEGHPSTAHPLTFGEPGS